MLVSYSRVLPSSVDAPALFAVCVDPVGDGEEPDAYAAFGHDGREPRLVDLVGTARVVLVHCYAQNFMIPGLTEWVLSALGHAAGRTNPQGHSRRADAMRAGRRR